MITFSSTQISLLAALSDGACHSGSALGKALGISRTAVWKQINNLITLGVPIIKNLQQGYCLSTPLTLLNEEVMRHFLQNYNFYLPLQFHLFASVDSTNRFLKELPASSQLEICCAEVQTAGRGRFGRYWHSPFGENIYCSTRWKFNCDLSRLSGLSLVVSLAIVAALKDFNIHENIQIKWPNDILWCGKKLCGCLVEINAEINTGADVIIGIGLNVNSITQQNPLPDKPWCSLYDIAGHYFDRNALISCLIVRLYEHISVFTTQGFSNFISQWKTLDYLEGQKITITHPAGTMMGQAEGVNSFGQLILIDEAGESHFLSSGDASLSFLKNHE